ncbi:hypothetical protein TraAM80_02256 [Trypanosoma rangeli]|uniref:F-box domain-containing protein n=1 Tax=Trypanosoma rangeli TaxID=5698 RepID=A0A422NV33_TRYRA|nr:uncharacterized protein TraAM80_02256 [Trypanosoma rangeli]RNF09309.1 hypothetical protein TraAM80_02256 [Trypanosoma rangeli]|eukprot:RNF09309.1 hypothetical protein TraAM80_02256 [Trypanosoma rangeli]
MKKLESTMMHNMAVELGTVSDDVASSAAMGNYKDLEYGERTRHADSPLVLRQAQLLGLLLLVSAALPSTSPTLEELALMSASASVKYPLGADVFRTGFNSDREDDWNAVEEVETKAQGERMFDYAGAGASKLWEADVTEADAQPRRNTDEDEEEEEEDTNNKKVRGGRRKTAEVAAGQAVDGAQVEAATPGTPREMLVISEGQPLMPIDADHHSTASGSSIGGSGSSSHLPSDSTCTSFASTPRRTLHPPEDIPSHHRPSIDCRLEAMNIEEGERGGRFGSLPDSVLLPILLFLSFPEVITLLSTNKRLSDLVRGMFGVNEHGVFCIPAFTGHPSPSGRYGGQFATGKTHSEGNKQGVTGAPKKTIRLFFGQQRRDNHPSSLRHLLNFLVPDVLIPQMEAHTNALNGRGKGCTWVFVTSQEDAKRLMQFNKLIFLDVNAAGSEVYLVAPPRSKAWIQDHAESVGGWATRPMYLPRQPMVIEMPEKPSTKRKRIKSQLQNQKDAQIQQVETECIRKLESVHGQQEEQDSQDGVSHVKKEEQLTMAPSPAAVSAEADVNTTTPLWGENHDAKHAVDEASSCNAASPQLQHTRGGTVEASASILTQWNAGRCSHRRQHNPYSTVYVFYSNEYTTTVCLDGGRYRHDPYIYNPLWEPAEPQMLAVIKEQAWVA